MRLEILRVHALIESPSHTGHLQPCSRLSRSGRYMDLIGLHVSSCFPPHQPDTVHPEPQLQKRGRGSTTRCNDSRNVRSDAPMYVNAVRDAQDRCFSLDRVSPSQRSESDTPHVAETHGAQCSLDRGRPCSGPHVLVRLRLLSFSNCNGSLLFSLSCVNWQRCCFLLVSLLFVHFRSFGLGALDSLLRHFYFPR
ncbi:hypothetical protein BDW02DRAFT_420312 [Decorospora gaudefroyi]|uniref:Uncharacterized protein n=1 Tax=Decorospora gaudefroyi TaxID=184978 RepID=A0A6A5K7Z5_9PLEO|nr:hypothetical protein BDW02DRAFT_420312 [Decorospora gaudefroyi]